MGAGTAPNLYSVRASVMSIPTPISHFDVVGLQCGVALDISLDRLASTDVPSDSVTISGSRFSPGHGAAGVSVRGADATHDMKP